MGLPTLVLLPGLDGTGLNFAPLEAALAPDETSRSVAYPAGVPLDFAQHVAHATARLPTEGPYLLVGESFSGPIATAVAASRPPGCVGLVLVATFVRFPLIAPGWAWRLAARPVLAMPPWRAALRHGLVGASRPDLADQVASAMSIPTRQVLASRVEVVLSVDAVDALLEVSVPILYLQGTRDRLVRRHNLAQLLAARPDITVERIDSPHLVLQCQPREALDRIRRWWNGAAGPEDRHAP